MGRIGMNDLISRQAAIDDAHSQIWYRLNPNMKERIDTWLVNLPSVQPEQKTGRWIEQTDTQNDVYYVCSNCKEAFTLIEGTPTDNLYNYCPNCGAKMDGRG